ncbi:tectonin domain-containing protein [Marinobacterium lacunae]|nr:tectonin domain-containing protein [Marinobacterium lacunae]
MKRNCLSNLLALDLLRPMRLLGLHSILFIASVLTSLTSQADESINPIDDWIASLYWQQLPGGKARDVGASDRDVVYVVSDENRLYRWRLESGWQLLSGHFQRVAIDSDHKPWAIDRDNRIRRYNGLWWDLKGELRARDIGTGSNGIAALDLDGRPYLWEDSERAWQALSYSGHNWKLDPGSRVALDDDGSPWVVLSSGRIVYGKDQRWQTLPIDAIDISAGGQNHMLLIGTDGKPYLLSENMERHPLQGIENAISISAGDNSSPWIIDAEGNLLTATSLISPTETPSSETTPLAKAETGETNRDQTDTRQSDFIAATRSTERTTTEPLIFRKIKDASANEIAIGPDGSVFALGAEGELLRWQNSRSRFLAFPGILKKIAIDPYGLPWGINTSGEVYRHSEGDWKAIPNIKAADITISPLGQIYVSNSAENIFRYNPLLNRFERISGVFGEQLAAASDNSLWIVRQDGRVYQCQQTECDYRKRSNAVDVSVGPEGSVFITTDRGQLYLWERDGSRWIKQFDNAVHVSVGPGGYPWVTDSKQQVWRTAFFERDESDDLALAQQTLNTTVDIDTSTSAITISKRLPLTRVKNPSLTAGTSTLWLATNDAESRVHLIDTGSAGSSGATWINSWCLNNPTDIPCLDTDMSNYCPSPAGQNDPGCQSCNDPANQGTQLCTAYNGSGGIIGWNNGYCLLNPQDPFCGMQPGCGSAACVDCSNPASQLGTVCVLLNNDTQTLTDSTVWTSSSTTYAFKPERKLPDTQVSWYLTDEDGRRWAIDRQNIVYRETSAGGGRFQAIAGTEPSVPGSNIRQLAANSGEVFALNDAQEVFRFDADRKRFQRYDPSTLYRRIAVGSSGELWGIDSGNRLKRYQDDVAINVPRGSLTSADELAIGSNGTVYILASPNRLMRYSPANDRFDVVKSNVSTPERITVDNVGRLWLIDSNADIYRVR